jgi:hypothetical protein
MQEARSAGAVVAPVAAAKVALAAATIGAVVIAVGADGTATSGANGKTAIRSKM